MKKINQILFGAILLAAVAFTSSCKKTSEPGPAGQNASRFPYKQSGTTLNISGNFYSDDASFDNQIKLPFFATLDENRVEEVGSPLRISSGRTSVVVSNSDFYITRYDSLGNSTLFFKVHYDVNNDEVYVNEFHFNVKTNITETTYKNVYTTYGGGGARTSGPYDNESSLSEYDMTNDGNSFVITNWIYDAPTKQLGFDYSGILTGPWNSTGNNLNVSGTVKAKLKNNSLRVAQ